jgi:hypothetical protein
MAGEQSLCPDAAPALRINPPVFQGFIHAAPLAPEAGRLGQFRQRAGSNFTRQGIDQLKERIGATRKTLPDLMTYLYRCVKVHLSNAPRFVLRSHYSLWQSSAMRDAFLGPDSLNINKSRKAN